MATFVPPKFADIGKKCRDMFKKSFNYDNKFKTKHTTSQGYQMETEGTLKDKTVAGQFTGTHKVQNTKLKVETHTKGELYGSVEATPPGPIEGLKVTVGAGHKENKKTKQLKCTDALEVVYARDFFTGTAKVENLAHFAYGKVQPECAAMADKPAVTLSGTIGTDGLSVGVNAELDVTHKDKVLSAFDFGVQYAKADFIGNFNTSKDHEVFTFGAYHTLPAYTIGMQCEFDFTKSATRTLKLGTDYKVDANTKFVSAYSTKGEVECSIKHNMSNPAVKVDASHKYSIFETDPAKKSQFGLTLSFGEF